MGRKRVMWSGRILVRRGNEVVEEGEDCQVEGEAGDVEEEDGDLGSDLSKMNRRLMPMLFYLAWRQPYA